MKANKIRKDYIDQLASSGVESDGKIRDRVANQVVSGWIQVDNLNVVDAVHLIDAAGHQEQLSVCNTIIHC